MNVHPPEFDVRHCQLPPPDPGVKIAGIRRASIRGTVRGFSLLELVVVMMVLVATAIIVLPMLKTTVATSDGRQATASEITTRTTLEVLRQAMVGDQGVMENLAHEPDALPREVSELVDPQPPGHLQRNKPQLARFDSIYRIGWRGPYIQPTGKNAEGQPTIIDGWGHEIEMQVDFDDDGQVNAEESRYMRLVSAGPNGRIDTPQDPANMEPGHHDQALTMSDCGDDLVVFLQVPDSRQ